MNTQNTAQSSIIHYFNSLVASVSRTGVSRVTPPSNHLLTPPITFHMLFKTFFQARLKARGNFCDLPLLIMATTILYYQL